MRGEVLEGKGSPYVKRLGVYVDAAMKDRHNFRKQRDKLREVVEYCYEQTQLTFNNSKDPEDIILAIESKIEELTDDDLGR